MVLIPKISALFETSLASAMSAAATSFSVVSGTDRDDNALSGLYGFVIDEGTADEEFVIGTISGTTVTITKRGCDADAPETEVSANKKAHRRGSSVKITDYPILAYLRNALAGETGYELPALLKLAAGVGNPTDDNHLTRKAYVDSVVAGSFPANRIVLAGQAGETLAAGNLIYLDDIDNEWKKSDADSSTTVENVILGIAQGAGTDGGAISNGVLLLGLDTNNTGLTNGQTYYASNTAGGISSSPGTIEVPIGMGTPDGTLYFIPRFAHFLTEDQQDALAGTSGTPSSSNKYVTNDDVASAATASKIARRNATGDVTVTTTPTATTDAASKSYADTKTDTFKNGTTTKDAADASTTQNIAHGLGKIPKFVRIIARVVPAAGNIETRESMTVYNGTTQSSMSFTDTGTGSNALSTNFILTTSGSSGTNKQEGVVTFDGTNIIITWTKTGSPTGSYTLLWEAFA